MANHAHNYDLKRGAVCTDGPALTMDYNTHLGTQSSTQVHLNLQV